MTMPLSRDQLRWELGPDLHVCLDFNDHIVVEVLGERAAVPHSGMMVEALRQAEAAQVGHDRPDLAGFALRSALLKFVEHVADIDAEDLATEAHDRLPELAAEARAILGRPPVPEVLEPLPPHGGAR